MIKLNKTYKIETAVKLFTYWAGAFTFIILLGKVSFFYYLISLTLFLFSLFLEYKKIYLNRTFINISAFFFIILKLTSLDLETLIISFLEILLFLLSLKFLENKKFRDYMQIYLLSVIIFAGSTLIFFDITFLVYLFLFIIILNASIVFLTYYSQDPEISLPEQILIKIFLKTGLIPLLAIPFTALFFIILPRTDSPFFGFLNKSIKAKSGFSENVKLGDVSEIQEEDLIVFRVKMMKINEDLLYWRGIVLDSFDGKTWFSSIKKNEEKIELKGTPILQTIYLEAYGDKYLFGLDKPYKINYNSPFQNINKKDLTFYLSSDITSRIKYEVLSFLTSSIYESKINKDKYLQLPQNLSERIKNLAKSLKGTTKEETIKNTLRFLKYGEYKYSLINLPLSSNALEDFLFKYKYGNCEYFASSMAILLRINHIPSRLVAGYKGGIYNEVGKYYLIRQKDAHVWVEAYIENKGWIRYDPTPLLAIQAYKKPKFSKIGLLFETINYYYINFVLNYDLKKQLSVVKSISTPFKVFNLKIILNNKTIFLYSSIFILSIIMGSFFILSFLKKLKIRKEERLIKEFLRILENKGYKKNPAEGLEEFASKIKEENLKLKVFNFVKIFEEIYYKNIPLTEKVSKKLKTLIKEIKNQKI